MIGVSKYSEKWALGVGFMWLLYPLLVILFKLIKGDIPKKSLHINMSMTGLVIWIQMIGFFPNTYNIIFDEKISFQLFALFMIIIFPFLKAGFMRYNDICKEYKEYYDLVTT